MSLSKISVKNFAVALLIQFYLHRGLPLPIEFPSYWIQCNSYWEYTVPDASYCDKYYTCKDGVKSEKTCPDGLGFVPFGECKPIHQVDCGPRILLQTPTGSGKCPRLNGAFSSPEGCGKFVKCYQGEARNDACPKGQIFDEPKVQCRYPTDVEAAQCAGIWYPETQEASGFAQPQQSVTGIPGWSSSQPTTYRCPENDAFPFGGHSRQPIPGQCKYFLICQSDGTNKIGGCPDGLGFNPKTMVCDRLANLPECYYYYYYSSSYRARN